MNHILTSATFGEASRSSSGTEKPALTAPRVCFLAPSLRFHFSVLPSVRSHFTFLLCCLCISSTLWPLKVLTASKLHILVSVSVGLALEIQVEFLWLRSRSFRVGVHATGFRWQALNQKTSLTARAVPFCTSLLFFLPNHVPQFVFEICCVSWQIGRWLVSRFGSSTEFSVVLSLFTPLLSCYKPRFERWWVSSRWSWVDFRVCLPYVAHSNHAAEIVSNSLPLIRHIKNPAKSVPSALTASADFKMPKVLRQTNP